MHGTESHYILPFWFIQAVERNVLSSAIDQPLDILFPFSWERDLKTYILFIDTLQKYTRDFKTKQLLVMEENFPTSFYLSHLLTQQNKKDRSPLVPIVQEVQTFSTNHPASYSHACTCTPTSYELIHGCFSAYSALFRNLNDLPNLDSIAKQAPLIYSQKLFSKTSHPHEIILSMRLERLRQTNLDAKSFHLSIEELLSNLDFHSETNSQNSWFQQAQVFLDSFLEKYKEFIKPIDLFFESYSQDLENLNFRSEQDTFSICLHTNLDKNFQKTLFEHQQNFSENFVHYFFDKELETFVKTISKSFLDSSYLNLEDFCARMSQQISKIDAKSFLSFQDGYLLNLPIVFVEWFIRSSPTHPMQLPPGVQESALCHIFKSQTFESLESRFDAFLAACIADPKESLEIFEAEFSCFASKACRANEDITKFLNSEIQTSKLNSPTHSISSDALPTPQKTTNPVNPSIESVPSKEPPSPNGDYKLKKHVHEELDKIIHLDPDQYHEIKGSYFASLNPDRRKMILEIQEKLGSEKFEEQLKPSLIRFMIENPTLWNQVNTKEKTLPPKSSFHSKAERLI